MKVFFAVTLAATLLVPGGAVAAQASGGIVAAKADAIPAQFLVTFKAGLVQQSAVGTAATELANKHSGKVRHVYRHALRGFSVNLPQAQARRLAADPRVARVEQDSVVRVADTQTNPPSWGVDRVDQRDLPLNQTYTYPANGGQGVTVYVLDTGIRRSHTDFGTRASFGPDFVDNDNDSTDCHGHGTHVAGTAVGTTYGVAKKANVVALRVLNCSGSGDFSGITAAIDWVTASAQKPAVTNMSLGGSGSNQTQEDAVRRSIASGVQYSLAAGNNGSDACNFTPARTPEAITVGNTQNTDARNSLSNYGTCLDIFAPGTSIVSASHSSDSGSATMTGTSMAAPHVAGAAALYLGANPNATAQQVRDALVNNATPDKVTSPGTGSPNKLLYMGFIGGGDTQPPTVPGNLRSSGSTSNSVSLAWDASTDNVGVAGYDVYTGSSLATTVTGTSATVTGLAADTSYTFTVKARDAAGNVSAASNAVSVRTPPGGDGDAIVNGGFEAGNLSAWSTSGTASVVNSGAHSGTYAARLGATTATNGESTLSQTFTAPAGAAQLAFWVNVTCPDTVYYAWAKATLRDNASGTTSTPLVKTCTNGQGWKRVTAPVTAGRGYTLTLVNRDDNYPDDPVFTLYDDVSFDTTVPGDDFSIVADPASLTVQAGQSVTTTIRTAVTSGAAQQVSLSATGLPTGVTAAFNPTTVTAGGTSTLTLSAAANAPSGNSQVTVLGDGTVTDRSTTVSVTVGSPTGGLQRVSTDTYTNSDSQHATQVESDAFAHGNMVVSAFQTGRYTNGGASNIAWSTSTDGGATWTTGNLRGLTVQDGGPHDRSTDPVVAFSAKHNTWLIGTTPLDESGGSARGLGMLVLRSSDGRTWSNPITAIGMSDSKNYDKNALGCDNTPSSPHYGNCYAVIDIFSESNQLVIAKSTDGGRTWGAAMSPSGVTGTLPNGVAALPNGTVVVVYDRVSGGNNQMVTRSTDGGTTWSAPINVSDIQWHQPNGGLRGNPMPDLDVDGNGKLYVSWPDSRFRSGAANDIVMSTSTDGQTWTAPVRIPIDAINSGKEHYFPELAVGPAGLALYYYFYDDANCSSASTCQLKIGYVSSTNGGASWSAPQTLAGPYPLTQVANTGSGRMIGDYSAGVMVAGKAVGVFSVGRAPTDGKAYDQAMYTFGPQGITGGDVSASGEPVTGSPSSGAQQRRTD